METRLTDDFVRRIVAPAQGQQIYFDNSGDKVRGFGLRVTAGGAKAFVLDYYFRGMQRRCTIGRATDWSADEARERARELRKQIDSGIDPLDRGPRKRRIAPQENAADQPDASAAAVLTDYLTEVEAAAELKTTSRTLKRYRSLGNGPKYIKLSGRIYYRRGAIREWLLAKEEKPGRRK